MAVGDEGQRNVCDYFSFKRPNIHPPLDIAAEQAGSHCSFGPDLQNTPSSDGKNIKPSEALASAPETFMKQINARLESLEGTINTVVSKCNISENKGLIVKKSVDIESNSARQ